MQKDIIIVKSSSRTSNSRLFFSIPSMKNMPKGKIPKKAFEEQLKNAKDRILDSSGSIFDDKNLDKINDFLKTAILSNSNFKIGSLIAGVAQHTINSILHDDSKEIMSAHSNDSIQNSDIAIFKTNVYMGEGHNAKIKSYLNGPVHEKFEKLIVDSQMDWMQSNDRKELTFRGGVNQRGLVFLGRDSLLTINDILELANHSIHQEKIGNQLARLLEQNLASIGTNSTNPNKKESIEKVAENILLNFKKKLKSREKKIIRYYSGLLSIETNLTLFNRMPVYDLNIVVHIVKMKNLKSNITTVEDVIKDILPISANNPSIFYKGNKYMKRIKDKELIKEVKNPKNAINFKNILLTTLNVNLQNLETFNENCIIVKSLRRRIPTGGRWHINILEKFKNGVYLNKVEELLEHGTSQETPISSFIVIEFFGDNRATVFRRADEESISNAYSPCIIGSEYKLSIKHLSHIEKPDEILCYTRPEKDNEFEDESLGMEFYPKREGKFHVDIENLIIGDEPKKKDAEYRLELHSSILENQQMTQIDNLIKRLQKVDPSTASSITQDDMPFFTANSTNLNKEDDKGNESNLRGKNFDEEEEI